MKWHHFETLFRIVYSLKASVILQCPEWSQTLSSFSGLATGLSSAAVTVSGFSKVGGSWGAIAPPALP